MVKRSVSKADTKRVRERQRERERERGRKIGKIAVRRDALKRGWGNDNKNVFIYI